MELMRLLFGTKDPRSAVSERETWIILLSRKPKKENKNTEERLAVSIFLNCILFFAQCNSNFSSVFPQFLQSHHRCASVTVANNIKSQFNYLAGPPF